MTDEFPRKAQINPDAFASIFASAYAVPRSVACGGKPYLGSGASFDAAAYASAAAKFQLAGTLGFKGAALSHKEATSYVAGTSILSTFIRHGGRMPWVPARWSEVHEAERVGGKGALPTPLLEHGNFVIDPFGQVASIVDPTAKAITDGARRSIVALAGAPVQADAPDAGPWVTDLSAGLPLPPQQFEQGATLGLGPAAFALGAGGIIVAGMVAWHFIDTWGDVQVQKEDSKQHWASVADNHLIDSGLASKAADLDVFAKTGNYPAPTPFDLALAKRLGGQSDPFGAWLGPVIGLAAFGVTGGLIYWAGKSAGKDESR